MIENKHKPTVITPGFYQLGTMDFPVYLSMADEGMLIEGGTGAFFGLIVHQIEELGIAPEKIKYIILTHTHSDHIGAVPRLKKLWPHLQVVGSYAAAKAFKRLTEKKEVLKEFIDTDNSISRIQLAKGAISEMPVVLDSYNFNVDRIVEEGERINLGTAIVWKVYNTPGHSPCQISLNDENMATLVIGDGTGFYNPAKDALWPNYFESLENYCHSIQKLSTLPANRIVLSHNGVLETDSRSYFERVMKLTKAYHIEMLERINKGENPEAVAMEKAKWVSSITDIQPFEVMAAMTKLLIKRSLSASKKQNLFNLP